jgi:transposase
VAVTSLPYSVSTDEVLETYRLNWQVEIHFKRLKSIPGFSDVPKKNPAASEERLNGKIMAALLIEVFFFPCKPIKYPPQYMA